MVLHTVSDMAQRDKLLKLHGRIASAEEKRHKITHGLWDFEGKDPTKLQASSFRAPYEFSETFDIDKLAKLAEDISEINFHLHFPNGPDSLTVPCAYVSRLALLGMMGKDCGILHPQQSILPKQERQQSSSEE